MAKLGNLKNVYNASSVAAGGQITLRAEIAKMKENISNFNELITEASKVAVRAGSEGTGSFASMRRKQMVDDPTRSYLERI